MSMYADIKNVFRKFVLHGTISEVEASEMFVDILGALEWDEFEFNWDNDYNEEIKRELEWAYQELFGK